MSYLPDTVFNEGFWSALTVGNTCPTCNYHMNGYTRKKALLSGPVECKCNKCGAEWSLAVPIDANDPARLKIEDLISSIDEFYICRDKLNALYDKLQGKS